jgi:hypothetical protein
MRVALMGRGGPVTEPEEESADITEARHALPDERAQAGPPPSSYGDYLAALHPADEATPTGRVDAPTAVTTPEADGVVVAAVGLDVATRELVTCPECGATQQVQVSRREAADFCERCDFPLFWVSQRVTRDREDGGGTESLRRLPGTVGRRTLASVPCPHCAEPNTVRAVVCVRCELPMHPVAPPPPPPELPPPPLPAPVEVVPERGTPWWVWVIVGVFAVTVLVVVLVLTGVLV